MSCAMRRADDVVGRLECALLSDAVTKTLDSLTASRSVIGWTRSCPGFRHGYEPVSGMPP
jgi:hypothetical protein